MTAVGMAEAAAAASEAVSVGKRSKRIKPFILVVVAAAAVVVVVALAAAKVAV